MSFCATHQSQLLSSPQEGDYRTASEGERNREHVQNHSTVRVWKGRNRFIQHIQIKEEFAGKSALVFTLFFRGIPRLGCQGWRITIRCDPVVESPWETHPQARVLRSPLHLIVDRIGPKLAVFVMGQRIQTVHSAQLSR